MIGFMPPIYPDELVYSWFCRYFVHSGYTTNKMALNDLLYNRHCNPSKEFIGHLNPEMEQVIKKMYPIDKLILEHTMFPQYARFIEISKKKDALYRLGHDFCDAHHLFSILPRGDGNQYMKYCPLCASEDRELYGEAYWHRQHQIRTVDVIQDRMPIKVENPNELDFAFYVVDIFEAPMDFDNDIAVSSILYYGMENTKYMKSTGKIRNSRMLSDDMLEYYSKINLSDIASYYQVQRTLLGNRSDFLVVSQIAFFLGMPVESLVNPTLSKEQVIKEQNARCPQSGNRLTDWTQYDEEMAPIVEQAAYDIYHGNINGIGRPERISERLINKYAGLPSHRIENLPKCKEVLKKYSESYDENWARRIIWAYKKLKDERQGEPIFWTDIRKLTGVKKKNLSGIMPKLRDFTDSDTAEEIVKLLMDDL